MCGQTQTPEKKRVESGKKWLGIHYMHCVGVLDSWLGGVATCGYDTNTCYSFTRWIDRWIAWKDGCWMDGIIGVHLDVGWN